MNMSQETGSSNQESSSASNGTPSEASGEVNVDKEKRTSESDPPETPSPAGREPVIECTGLTKTYRQLFSRDETTAVDGVDLTVYRGEIFGLLGPNGSGKTTTMKLLLGLLFPDSGEARVLNRKPDDVATKERIGFLPEESQLYDFLTGKETLEFYASLFGMSASHQAEKVDELLKSVGLWEDRNRKLQQYSKGMTRRIGFAQALINDPDVIFLDEPTVGLDPIIAKELKDQIVELRNQGKTLVVSSHVLADVEDICDRVAILHEGIKRREGQVEEMLKIREELEVIVESDDSEDLREEIRSTLADKGWNVKGFAYPTRTLENLFLSTIRESRDAS